MWLYYSRMRMGRYLLFSSPTTHLTVIYTISNVGNYHLNEIDITLSDHIKFLAKIKTHLFQEDNFIFAFLHFVFQV